MAETLKKGTRVTGVDRSKLATNLSRRYDSGESIRSLAASTGRSYGFVHRIRGNVAGARWGYPHEQIQGDALRTPWLCRPGACRRDPARAAFWEFAAG